MKRNTKLTIKQAKFIKEYIKTGNGTQAALKAYDTTDSKTASVISAENLEKPSVKNKLLQAQEKLGITEKYLSKKLKDGLNAKESKFAQDKGRFIDEKECIDYPTRSKYLEIAHKLRGDFAPTELNVTNTSEKMTEAIRARIRAQSEIRKALASKTEKDIISSAEK